MGGESSREQERRLEEVRVQEEVRQNIAARERAEAEAEAYRRRQAEEAQRQKNEETRRRQAEETRIRQEEAERKRKAAEEAKRQKEEAIRNHWRHDTITSWNEEERKNLSKKIKDLSAYTVELSPGLEYFRIIFIGHTGAGKSSLINAFITAILGRVSNTAIEGGKDHTTEIFSEYHTKDDTGKKLVFSFCDLKGLGHKAAGSTSVDILRAVRGEIGIQEKLEPGKEFEDMIDVSRELDKRASFMIVYVMDAAAYYGKIEAGENDPWLQQLLDLKAKTDKWGVFGRALVMTHMDHLDPTLEYNINLIHHNGTTKRVVDKVIQATGFPMRCIFPVVCPVKHVHQVPVQFQVHLLYTIHAILQDAVDMLEHRLYIQSRE